MLSVPLVFLLKIDNAWEWVGRMNNIQACAMEIVDKEIIYQ